MKMGGLILSFMAGSMCGVMAMCLVVAGSRYEEREEAMTVAGGSGKQDSEPCDQHDKTDDPDGDLRRAGVSAAPEGSGGTEVRGEADRETDGSGADRSEPGRQQH